MKKLSSFLLAALLFVSTLLFVVPSASAATWQNYVVEALKTGNISQVAIISKDGTSVLAHSEGFEPSASEIKVLVDAYKNPSAISSAEFTLNGTKYLLAPVFATIFEGLLLGKKEKGGSIIAQTEQIIVIGTYGDNIAPGNAIRTVDQLAKKLYFERARLP